MVDRDKIKKRSDKRGSDDSPSKKRKKSGSSSSGSSPDSDGMKLDSRVEEDTFEDKMDKLKGGSGGTSAQTMVKRSHAAKVLESMANILLYTEGRMRSYENPDNKREDLQHGVTSTMYEHFTKLIGNFNVQTICERNGIDWQEDVIEAVLEDQNFEQGLDNISDPSNTAVNVGRGKKLEKKHFHQLLLALGHVFMFTKTLEKKYENPSDRREKMGLDAITDVSAKCIDFIGSFGVEEIARENGISFERDILDEVGG